MSQGKHSAVWLAFTALGSVVLAAAALVGLGRLAVPEGFDSRVAEVESRLDRAERLASAPVASRRYGAEAACPGVGDAELAELQQRLAASAQQASVTLTDLSTRAERAAAPAEITPVALRLQGEGPYDSVQRWLTGLAQSQPEIFVEAMNINAKSPNVTVKLTGKVFCWTS